MEYRTTVLKQEGEWFAKCSCSGFTKLSEHEEPIKPCVHAAYLIREKMPKLEGQEADTPQPEIRSPLDVSGSACHIVPGTEAPSTEPRPQPGDIEAEAEVVARQVPTPEQAAQQQAAVEASRVSPTVSTAPKDQTDDIETRSIWPSGLAIIDACPGAAWGDNDPVVVKSTGLPATIGSCVHKIGQDIVEQKLTSVPDLEPYLLEYDIEKSRDDVFFPSLFLSQAWSGYKGEPGLSQYFPSPICEKKLEHTILAMDPATGRTYRFRFAGKADVLAFSAPTATEMPTSAALIDWKSGDRDKAIAPLQQMWATAFIVAAKFKTIRTVKVSFVWLRDRNVVTVEFTRDELRDFMLRFIKYKAFWDGRNYEKGDHCLYCPRLATCPGRMQLISSIASGLSSAEGAPLSIITDEHGNLRSTDVIARAIKQGRFLQKVLYSFFDELAVQLYESGAQAIEGEDGSWIGVTERAGKTSIAMEKAWPILVEMFSEEQVRAMSACSKSTLQKAVYESTEYGQKKAAMESLIGQLDEAGAVTRARNSRSVGILTDPKKAVCAPKEG